MVNDFSKMSYNQAKELVLNYDSLSKIIKYLGYRSSEKVKDLLRDRLIELKIDFSHFKGEKNILIFNKPIKELHYAVEKSSSFTGLFKILGCNKPSKNLRERMKKHLIKYNIDFSHFFGIKSRK